MALLLEEFTSLPFAGGEPVLDFFFFIVGRRPYSMLGVHRRQALKPQQLLALRMYSHAAGGLFAARDRRIMFFDHNGHLVVLHFSSSKGVHAGCACYRSLFRDIQEIAFRRIKPAADLGFQRLAERLYI